VIVACVCAGYKRIRSQATVSIVSLVRCISHENGITGITTQDANQQISTKPTLPAYLSCSSLAQSTSATEGFLEATAKRGSAHWLTRCSVVTALGAASGIGLRIGVALYDCASVAANHVAILGALAAHLSSRVAHASLTTGGAGRADLCTAAAVLHVIVEVNTGATRAGAETWLAHHAGAIQADAAGTGFTAGSAIGWIIL
jgi:hypothetical protein